MPVLIITRGLPASGKTTWAKERLASDMPRAARVNRDDLRRIMHGGRTGENWAERQVTLAQFAAAGELLRNGVDVICDDTNLRARAVHSFAELAHDCGAAFEVHDLTDVPLEVCLARDAGRPEGERVGEPAIRAMWERFLADRGSPLPVPGDPDGPAPGHGTAEHGTAEHGTPGHGTRAYRPGDGLPEAVLVDLDGTVALIGDRSPYDMSRVGDDLPNHAVITAVRAMHAFGHHIVFVSGRSDDGRTATQEWLARHVGVPYEGLFMRRVGDHRRDATVKSEIFEREIRHRWAVTGVFDDRNQVVTMWRSLGLTVFQVAEGNF